MAGSGSLEKRGDKTWRLIASCGMKGDKQIKKKRTVTVKVACEQKSCQGCTRTGRCQARREAEKLLTEFVIEIEKGTFIDPTKLTFEDFVDRWLRDYAELNLAPKTLSSYRDMLKKYILPAFAHLKLEQVKPAHLMAFYTNLQENGIRCDGKPGGLSDKTISYAHRIISSILQTCVQWQIIATNPASRIKPPKVIKKQASCYDEQQTATLIEALENEPLKYKTIIYLALFTGCRRGEIMGLEWKDIDSNKNTLVVRQTSQYLPGQGIFTKGPKNESSERLMALPTSIVTLLKQYKAYQAEERLKAGDLWQGSKRLFSTWDGKPMHPDTVSKWFPKFLKRHSLPSLPFHGLRHTAATMLINQGLPAKSISGRLGHADIGTTYNIYGHYLKSADREAADRLEQVYQNMNGNGKKDTTKGQA